MRLFGRQAIFELGNRVADRRLAEVQPVCGSGDVARAVDLADEGEMSAIKQYAVFTLVGELVPFPFMECFYKHGRTIRIAATVIVDNQDRLLLVRSCRSMGH